MLLAVVWVVAPACAEVRADDAAQWNRAKAGEYLDGRSKTWFEFTSADRGEGATKTTCVSCHTMVPYALARPALRKMTGAAKTESEDKLVAQTKARVAAWADLDTPRYKLMYDFNEQKKVESWGTEAVLNALVLATDDRAEGRKTPDAPTKLAFVNLWKLQTADGAKKGSWDWLDFGFEPWEAGGSRYYGACLAAIAVGTAPGYYAEGKDAELDAKVALLRGYLKDNFAAQNDFNRVWALWASSALGGVLAPEQKKDAVARILAKQRDDGGWSLSSLGDYVRKDGTPLETTSDGYATGLVLHVLQTAVTRPDDPKVAKGLARLRTSQEGTGEWKATSLNKKRDPASHAGRFMTDAATAFAVLALGH
jgi:squalene-hopene/tetraprenyl-beta-curcumene cyclase